MVRMRERGSKGLITALKKKEEEREREREREREAFGAETPPSSINLAAIEISIIDGAENSGLFDSETPSRIILPYISLSVFR